MAVSEITTVIANPSGRPARKRRKRNVGLPRNASLKQKLHFGTPRQRAAAKASLSHSRKHKRKHNPGMTTHRRRRNAGPFSLRKSKKSAKRGGMPGSATYVSRVAKGKTRERRRKAATRRHNPGEIIALTALNPAKGRRKMARRSHRRKHASSHAGRRRNPSTRMHHKRVHSRRRHNPGQVAGMVRSAVAAGVGFLGSKIATQAILGAGNTGFMGYLGNAVATGILSWGTHAFTKNKMDAFMVGVGGTLNILGRVIADNSLLGQYSSQLGMGDYLIANWWVPQRLDGDPFSLTTQAYDMSWMPQQQIPIASAAPPGMGYLPAPIPSVYGNDLY